LTTSGRDSIGQDKRYVNPELEINGVLYNENKGNYSTDLVVDYINDFIKRKKNKPFLVYYPMILTHCPFDPTPHSEDWDPTDPGSKTYKGNAKYFGDMVSYMDYSIGRIVNQLNKLKLRENTLILFTGDNGTDEPVVSMMDNIAIEGGKGRTTDNGTHVPLIANWKGKIKPNQNSKALIDFSDFFPTFCEVAGISIDSDLDLDGVSFYSELIGKKGRKKDWIHTWYNRDGGSNPKEQSQEWVRNENYKLYVGNRFYNIVQDPKEKNPLKQKDMTIEERKIYNSFTEALRSYISYRRE
jgi:arylsulfatase A